MYVILDVIFPWIRSVLVSDYSCLPFNQGIGRGYFFSQMHQSYSVYFGVWTCTAVSQHKRVIQTKFLRCFPESCTWSYPNASSRVFGINIDGQNYDVMVASSHI